MYILDIKGEFFDTTALRLSPQLIAFIACTACSVAITGQAKAGLVYEILQQGSDVKVNLSGSLQGIGTGSSFSLGGQFFSPTSAAIYLNQSAGSTSTLTYDLTGPSNFGSGSFKLLSSIVASANSALQGNQSKFYLASSYTQGDPITGSGTLSGQTLSGLGLSATSGLLASWTFNNNPSETIQVWAGPAAPPPAAVPGPLPLLGAGAAFSCSRRLRSRLRAAKASTQA